MRLDIKTLHLPSYSAAVFTIDYLEVDSISWETNLKVPAVILNEKRYIEMERKVILRHERTMWNKAKQTKKWLSDKAQGQRC